MGDDPCCLFPGVSGALLRGGGAGDAGENAWPRTHLRFLTSLLFLDQPEFGVFHFLVYAGVALRRRRRGYLRGALLEAGAAAEKRFSFQACLAAGPAHPRPRPGGAC